MSVIAWDGQSLAADRRSVNGNRIATVSKIFAVNDRIAGFVGRFDEGAECLAWLREGCHPDTFPPALRSTDNNTQLIVVLPDGWIWCYERTPMPVKFPPQKIAFGCGCDFAIAAMECGKTATEAVMITCKFDAYCGNGVDAYRYTADGTIEHSDWMTPDQV